VVEGKERLSLELSLVVLEIYVRPRECLCAKARKDGSHISLSNVNE
jgi:hypothetical protein